MSLKLNFTNFFKTMNELRKLTEDLVRSYNEHDAKHNDRLSDKTIKEIDKLVAFVKLNY